MYVTDKVNNVVRVFSPVMQNQIKNSSNCNGYTNTNNTSSLPTRRGGISDQF